MIHCLFLIYNPINLPLSLNRLSRFLKKLDPNYRITIINNGGIVKIDELQNIKVVDGDNSYWEFSGWAVGKEYLENNNLISESDNFCIVNDTFDKNHYFSRLTSCLYAHRWKKIKKNVGGVLGELHHRDKKFLINNIEFSSWISSYFFLLDYNTFNEMDFLSEEICRAVLDVDSNAIEFDSAIVGEELAAHINAWLRPSSSGWYLARVSTNGIIKKKAIAILHEKLLSAKLQSKGTAINNVYAGILGRLINKFDRVVFNLIDELSKVRGN